MKTKIKSGFLYSLILLLTPLLWVGCVTPKPPPPPNTRDFAQAATVLSQRLLEKGVLDKVANPPAKIRFLTVVNNTDEHMDTSLFENKIQVALNESGKVSITLNPAMGVDYILSGKILSTYVRTSESRSRTYTFQLTLTDPQGSAVWVGEEEFTK
jgi:PBP1b-binding outer membrane lipoprotein LpoB